MIAVRNAGVSTLQTSVGIGAQYQNSAISAIPDARTKVLRSAGAGMNWVHQRLKPWRAIPLCWTANTVSSARLISSACCQGSEAPPMSIDFGTPRLATKPTA